MPKVLIIAYYWPPAGGPGVQRWLKFVKYLRDFDIEPVLYIPKNPQYPIQDVSLLSEIPKYLTIYRYPIREPYGLARFVSPKKTQRISSGIIQTNNQSIIEKILLWVRGNLFIPDARKYWIKPSVKFLSEVLEKEKIDTIITTGPPHSIHMIGYGLKQKHRLKWLADFRDPWTSIGYHKKLKLTASSRRKHKKLERCVLQAADKVIVTSHSTKKEFENITSKPIRVITNGYDSDYKGNQQLDRRFTVSHIGSLLTGRSPKNLWQVFAELIDASEDFKKQFRLQLIGVVSEDVLASIYENGLKEYVEIVGYLSHEEAVQYQRKSQVLLLVEIDSEETQGIIPGKLFEYMAAKRPILGLGPKQWEAGRILVETETGEAFTYDSHTRLKSVLLEWFTAFGNENLNVASKGIERYSRKELTKQLAKHLSWESF
ncbi:MAG: glycosyltransferase family 4 protein [Flavobacteriaceae bacterium]